MPTRHSAGGQVVVDEPPRRPSVREPVAGPDASAGSRSAALRSPIFLAFAACLALGALSAALLPTVPSYDPWAWIVWGREVVDPHLSFATGGGPSWKPLPVMFTTVFGLFGGVAPTLWVITARAGGLLALVAAWRLGSRLARAVAGLDAREMRVAGVIAGVVAVLGVILTQDFVYYMFRGTSEPMLIATVLWWVDRLLARRDAQAFVVGVAAALIRPEAWPFLALYAVWLWVRRPGLRPLVLAGILAVPFFWFVPPWIGSGQPFLAASHAKAYNGHLGRHPALEAIRRSLDLQTIPVLVGAAAAVALTWLRERDRITLALAGGALAWVVLVVAMVIDGYPGLERFFLGSAALLCVLAGVGFARVAVIAGRWIGGRAAGIRLPARAASVAVAVLLVAVSIPLCASRIDSARAQRGLAQSAVSTLNHLSAAVRAVGGHAGVYPCRSSFAAVNHGAQTALAWKLHVTLGRVGTSLRKPGVDFIGAHNATNGAPAPIDRRLTSAQLLARVDGWRVYRMTDPAHSSRCVGR